VYEVAVSETFTECKSLQSQWIKLVETMDYPSPFVHPSWVLTTLESNSKEWMPYIISVKHNDTLIALLPLYKNKENFVRELRYAGDIYHPDPLGICCNAENRMRSIDLIKKYLFRRNDWDVLCLKWMLHDEADEWEVLGSTHWQKSTIAPYLSLPDSFDEYLKSFKRKKRYNLNASVQKFDKSGSCYHVAENYDDAQNLLKHLYIIHEKRSAERGIVSSFAGTNVFTFHDNIIKNMDNVWLCSLEIQGEIIAVLYGFIFKGRFFYYQIAHDPAFRAISPGTVLLYKVIRECCNSELEEFNFLQGDEKYKWQWTKESRTLFSMQIYNRTLGGILSKYKDKMRLAAKELVGIFKK